MYREIIGHRLSSRSVFEPSVIVAQTLAYGITTPVCASLSRTIRWKLTFLGGLTSCMLVPLSMRNGTAVIASAVIFIPCQSATPRTWVGIGLTPPAEAAASAAAAAEPVGQAGMVMPGMLPQLAIGLAGADAAGLALAGPAAA